MGQEKKGWLDKLKYWWHGWPERCLDCILYWWSWIVLGLNIFDILSMATMFSVWSFLSINWYAQLISYISLAFEIFVPASLIVLVICFAVDLANSSYARKKNQDSTDKYHRELNDAFDKGWWSSVRFVLHKISWQLLDFVITGLALIFLPLNGWVLGIYIFSVSLSTFIIPCKIVKICCFDIKKSQEIANKTTFPPQTIMFETKSKSN